MEYENVKCEVNVRTKIKKPRLLHAWLNGVDSTMCQSNNRPIIFAIQSSIALKQATSKAIYAMRENKRLTSLRAVGFESLVHIRGKINLETSEHDFLGKADFSDTVGIR